VLSGTASSATPHRSCPTPRRGPCLAWGLASGSSSKSRVATSTPCCSRAAARCSRVATVLTAPSAGAAGAMRCDAVSEGLRRGSAVGALLLRVLSSSLCFTLPESLRLRHRLLLLYLFAHSLRSGHACTHCSLMPAPSPCLWCCQDRGVCCEARRRPQRRADRACVCWRLSQCCRQQHRCSVCVGKVCFPPFFPCSLQYLRSPSPCITSHWLCRRSHRNRYGQLGISSREHSIDLPRRVQGLPAMVQQSSCGQCTAP
jgi:hypothetical protein